MGGKKSLLLFRGVLGGKTHREDIPVGNLKNLGAELG